MNKEERKVYMKAYSKQYYRANKKKILRKSKVWANSNQTKRKEIARDWQLKKVGWDRERYDLVFAEQKGVCAICKQPVKGVLDADHEHVEPPKPRGLLCHLCNLGIGVFKDDPNRLKAALNYLRKFGKKCHVRK